MSQARPKRKATINKSYNDSLQEFVYEEASSTSSINSSSSSPGTSEPKRKYLRRAESDITNSPTPNGKVESSATSIPNNWQSTKPLPSDYFSHKLDLTDAYIDLKTQTLFCPQHEHDSKDIFRLSKGEYVYMVSEPPGEPYYIGRILGFKEKGSTEEIEKSATVETFEAKDYLFQIQWFYRPRDISKSTSDSRLLFASMHTDTCPIPSFRGLVQVKHKKDIEDEYATKDSNNGMSTPPGSNSLETYSQQPNSFYFDKLFDRYMIKFYDVLLSNNLLLYTDIKDSKSKNFLVALHKRFEYVFAESQSTKALIKTFSSSSSNCEVCDQWCGDSSQDSIKCIECSNYYHMFCLDPPMMKKPSRGFSWSCAVCTKKHDIEYQRKKMLMLSHDNKSSNADQLSTELDAISTPPTREDTTPPPSQEEVKDLLPKYESMAIDFLRNDSDLTLEQRRIKEEWPMRYMGMHSRLEDVVDLEDRSPYPRASTRLGAKHQATNIPECYDTPLVYYDVEKITKKKTPVVPKKLKSEVVVKLEIPDEFKDVPMKDFPQWLQPRPKGYIERGEDDGEGLSCTLLWKPSPEDEADEFEKLDSFIESCTPYAEALSIFPNSPNFVDAVLKIYMENEGNVVKSLNLVSKLTKPILKEPTFNKEEIKRFEAGVKEFGSELFHVFKKVKTQPQNMIVRFYYLWKKSENGKKIWGNFEGRIQKKLQNLVKEESKTKQASTPGIDSFADPEDDSCYESDKIIEAKKMFTCKHCLTHVSRQWFRITGHNGNAPKPDAPVDPRFPNASVIGLCFRCARLWRRYAVVWEDPLEIDKRHNIKYAGWKKKIEAELIRDSEQIIEHANSLGASIVTLQEDFVESSVIADVAPPKRKYTKRKPAEAKKETLTPEVEEPKRKKVKSETIVKKEIKKVKEVKEEPKVIKKKVVKEMTPEEHVQKAPRKRKPKEETDDDKKLAPAKRLKRPSPSITDKVINPILNKNYLPPTVSQYLKIDKKNAAKLTKEIVKDIISTHRARQLTDITSQLQTTQIPNLSIANLPFEHSKRKCCVCKDGSGEEMLVCAHCGVNAHSSCTGISIPDQVPRPVKEWLCEPCVNDLNPTKSTVYSCSICLANESNYEFSMLGLELVSPDYLKPINDNGKWCHLICAICNHENVEFRQSHSAVKKLKAGEGNNQKLVIESISNPLMIESVSKIFLNNFKSKCGICDTFNGAMIHCDLCQTDKFHITCAQDTANFQLGFKLVESKEKIVKVEHLQGRLKPTLICPNHQENLLGFRALGKRLGGSLKPLITLFIEDLLKSNVSVLNGPQLRSSNYIQNKKLFEESKSLKPQSSILSEDTNDPSCSRCKTISSPIWWFANEPQIVRKFSALDLYLCQSCYQRDEEVEDDEEEVVGLLELLNKPISGENYGIIDENDRLREKTRQKISFVDILS